MKTTKIRDPNMMWKPDLIAGPDLIDQLNTIADPNMMGKPNMIGELDTIAGQDMMGDPNMMGEPDMIGEPDMMGDPNLMGEPNLIVETLHATSLRFRNDQTFRNNPTLPARTKKKSMALISPKPGSLSAIVRSYKSAVSKHAHRMGYQFEWQPRFHEHIIRDENEFQRIREYIINNPKNWHDDKFWNQ
jgi:REP element-mobilizing transposase RayT